MAATKTPEISATELELKRRGRRRLIGAVTLGLMAIVFLPMIFDSEPKRVGEPGKTQEISVQVPPKENQPPLPAPTPMASAPVAPAAEAAKAAPEPAPTIEAAPATAAPKAVTVAPAKSPEKSVAKEATKPAAKVEKSEKPEKASKPEASPKAAAVKDGFVVQLGVYTKAENADKEIARMKEAKLPVHTDTIPIKTGNATRVRVGPYATREKAEAALAQIKLAGGEGKIVPTK